MSDEPLLKVENLHVHFATRRGLLASRRRMGQVKAVDGVSFEVASGEAFGIVGESGSGKSTIAASVMRLLRPTAGRILIDGLDITHLSEAALRPLRREVQMVFQDTKSSLNPYLTVEQIVREPLITYGLPSDRVRILEILARVGLGEAHIDRYSNQLSGGQRQRIGIARAIALSPRLIVADEPVSALDVSIQAQILNLLRSLRKELGLGFVLISHDISVVSYFCQRVGVMYLGRLVEQGPTASVMRQPSHPYTKALISAVPGRFGARAERRILLRGEAPDPISPPRGCAFHTRCPVKMGSICETFPPPYHRTAGGGWAACHLLSSQSQIAESQAGKVMI
ncbi:hypothetical protein GCM10010869_11440 [Mesorhizobium tianshanense]|uniref:Peptide/nickel transport system ATP-binding protein/oligopeptide transport system ATP-binding protein n=1 Tax=Mesorhizobium tianshanense TaxID=39844 RepID=A0A562MBK0_9HYPH|nr:ABC transporter ATP-binding protein [Mesorhizobium tianshanense]TWI17274.1 peptide/nickel transport system ATP-binding protein/oligopeptide transport system ATP-binding protein [Mesorhizobium tianshanense]GLS35556.1 hypothetical protein GCM10010869_11440 [Mesorhizobium tianshanense]